jgi:hypothetical protein
MKQVRAVPTRKLCHRENRPLAEAAGAVSRAGDLGRAPAMLTCEERTRPWTIEALMEHISKAALRNS